MPRNFTSGLAANLAGGLATTSVLVNLKRADGTQLGFTDNPAAITYGGLTYQPSDGLDMSAIQSAAGSGVDNTELSGFLTVARVADADIEAGLYDNAEITVSIYDRTSGEAGVLHFGYLGEVTLLDQNRYRAEVRGLAHLLKQSVGDVTCSGCLCRRVGDAQCKVTMTGFRGSFNVAALGVAVAAGSSSALLKNNCGGGAVSPYTADAGSTGTNSSTVGTTISIAGLVNPAPMSVYQSNRWEYAGTSLIYNLTGYTAGASYLVRMHWAETGITSPVYLFGDPHFGEPSPGIGVRKMNVIINGQLTLTNFDVYAQAGGPYIGIIEETTVVADATGKINITINATEADAGPMISAIEVYSVAPVAVASGIQFASNSAVDGYYNFGFVKFTTGANAGIEREIKTHRNSSGAAVVSLRTPFPFAISIGDTATLEAGCDHTITTCTVKFSNAINFHGFPYLPGNDVIGQVGRPPR